MHHTNGNRLSPAASPKLGQHNLAFTADNHPHLQNVPKEQATTKNSFTNTKQEESSRKTFATADIIGEVIGDFGIWQLRTILIIFLCKIPASWFMACIIFTAPELYPQTEFICDYKSLTPNQSTTLNQCYIEDAETGQRQECTEFLYDSPFQSLVMDFNLVCLRDIFVAWTQYWHLFGVLVGGVVGTKMMLIISPRNVYFIGQMAQIVCGVVTGYARDFSLHCAFRCLSAVCCAIMFTAGQAIFADITSGIYRIGAIILYDTFWSLGVILLPSLASLFHNWSHVYLGITFPTLILTLLLEWTPESPRWLLKNGDEAIVNRVADIICQGAAINGRLDKIPPDFKEKLLLLREQLKSCPAPAKWLQLWQGPRAKINMIAMHLALAAFIINFMGMLLNIRSFGRDYLATNTVAMGFAEIVGCFLALHFTLKCSKWKWQWAGGFNILAGLLGCLGWLFSSAEIKSELKVTLWMIIATVPKAGVSCAQSMILACMQELMAANKKLPFAFSVVTWARVWLLTAPFINVLKKIDVALSLTAYCALSIFGGICTCLILTPTVKQEEGEADCNSTNKNNKTTLTKTLWTVEMNVNNTRL